MEVNTDSQVYFMDYYNRIARMCVYGAILWPLNANCAANNNKRQMDRCKVRRIG